MGLGQEVCTPPKNQGQSGSRVTVVQGRVGSRVSVTDPVPSLHHGRAQMTHGQNSKPELFLRDVIIIVNKDVYIEQMSGT